MDRYWDNDGGNFYRLSEDEIISIIGHKFFHKSKHDGGLYIPVRLDKDTEECCGLKYSLFHALWVTDIPSYKCDFWFKVMIDGIDDFNYGMEFGDVPEWFAKSYLLPKIIDWVIEHDHIINGEAFLEFCESLYQEGRIDYN